MSASTGSSTAPTATPGGAPGTGAVIPQSSTGTMAPTPPSNSTASPDGTRLVAPAQDAQNTASLVQQVLDALDQSRVDAEKVKKYLPDFLKKLREDLGKELRGEREPKHDEQADPATGTPSPTTLNSSVLVAYQASRQTSISFSLRT